MRLDDFDPKNIKIEDQRGQRAPRLRGSAGKFGIGSFLLAGVAVLIFGADPVEVVNMFGQDVGNEAAQPLPQEGGRSASESCTMDTASKQSCDTLSSLNSTWKPIFQESGANFNQPKLVFYAQNGQSGCGAAQSAMGPFYCPADQGIYLDTDFYRQMEEQLGAKGAFARDYVMAHEYGHHLQTLLGTSNQMRAMQAKDPANANRYSVMLELQADCYAGVWAGLNKERMEPGDMVSGLNAAHQIGDDTLLKSAGRKPVEEMFTHGTSEQRQEWLRRGMDTADPNACDTFSQSNL